MTAAFLLERARPHRGSLILICAMTLMGSMTTLAIPWLGGQALGGLLGEDVIDLSLVLVLLALALIVGAALDIVIAITSELAAGRILAGLRQEAYLHVQRLPVRVHNETRLGDLLALITYEVDILSGFLASTLASIPSNLLTATGALILLFLIDPWMAVIVPVLVPAFLLVMKIVGRHIRRLAQISRNAEAEVFSLAERDLEILSAIKSFAQEDSHRRQYCDAIEQARRASLSQKRLTAPIMPVTALVAAFAAIAILLIGSTGLTGAADRSASELLAFLLYAALLTRPASNLASVYGELQWARGTFLKLSELLAIAPEPGYAVTAAPEPVYGAIAFEGISFSYPGRSQVLNRVNLEIAAGEIVALTGPNGVGKSTLVNLLLRFYEPQEGRITLDGVDIREINVQHLRRQIGYVPQRALLFNGTVRDNITFGEPNADPARLDRAVRLSGTGDFVDTLPMGLATVIGDHGIRLSGGQRQRIALARALYADPPILVFDEATSMYDMASEATFVDACIQSLSDRTIIIITHRTASLALADRVLEATPRGYRTIAP